MRLENFVAEDYYKLELDMQAGLEVWMPEESIPRALLELEHKGVSRSLWIGDKLYAVFGLLEIRSGVIEVFFFGTKGWCEKKKTICQAIKRDLDVVSKMFNRVQMTCLEGDQFLRFAKFFGFEKEGSLKHYDKLGRTYSMLAITGGVL